METQFQVDNFKVEIIRNLYLNLCCMSFWVEKNDICISCLKITWFHWHMSFWFLLKVYRMDDPNPTIPCCKLYQHDVFNFHPRSMHQLPPSFNDSRGFFSKTIGWTSFWRWKVHHSRWFGWKSCTIIWGNCYLQLNECVTTKDYFKPKTLQFEEKVTRWWFQPIWKNMRKSNWIMKPQGSGWK